MKKFGLTFSVFALCLITNLLRAQENQILEKIENKKLSNEVNLWLGTPYKYGGRTMKGTDCSGFVFNIYKSVFNIELSRSSSTMIKDVDKVFSSQLKLREGDLIFFKIDGRKISHVGIYLIDGYFVHASSYRGVVINNLSEDYYKKHYYKSGRLKQIDNKDGF